MTPLVHIDRDDNLEAPDDESFRRWVAAALLGAGQDVGPAPEISIRINDVAEMTELNTTYRRKTGPTNVLSFPVAVPQGVETDLLGDIAICAPVVAQEAAEQNKSKESHWAHMTVHGVLHLLGFDHIEEQEAETMEKLEVAIMAQLTYPDPYQFADIERASIP